MDSRDYPMSGDKLPQAVPEDAQSQAARIGAELAGLDDGTDPFAAAVRATRMPMIITNPREFDNPIVFANDAFARLTGYSREETLGRNCRFLQGPEIDSDTVDAIRGAIATAEPIEIDIQNRRKDGSLFWNRLLIAPVRDKTGDVAYFFASQFDITRERQAIEASTRELAEARRKLQAEAAERERVEHQLRQSHKLEAVGQLTGGIAHDFNNMLQAISSSLELTQRRTGQGRREEAEQFLDGARRTVERAAALTARLLSFARRQVLETKPVMLDSLVDGMAELIRRTVGPGVAVQMALRNGNWTVLCDANQLESVLLNLVINARDAMPAGGTLTIGTQDVALGGSDLAGQDELRAGNYVELYVSDTGIGMDKVTMARAFEPFFTTKPLGQGTGLGLSQLYGLIRQLDGAVRLDSAPGQGTTVRLYLPRHAVRPAPDAPHPAVEPDNPNLGETILLVEDEPAIRAMAAEQLRELGYRVIEAEDGTAALNVLRSNLRVNALVTDVGLPGGLNGRQIADAARERRPGLPVLFITGYAGNLFEGQLAQGMGVIVKPFALDALAARVRAMLQAPEDAS